MKIKINDLQWLKEKAAILANKFNLKLVILFGSTAGGFAREQSDLDIAVLAEDTTSRKSSYSRVYKTWNTYR